MSNTDDENIQKISKMLEIGGTMLAQHCDSCGAPLFRYQGRVLCPVCEDIRDPRRAVSPAPAPVQSSSGKNELSSMKEKENSVAASSEKSVSLEKTTVRSAVDSASVSGSFSELESLLISKMTSMAREMQGEADGRRIAEYLDLIDRCMDIAGKMRN
ncbi:Sjogren's syndrome/scleroderma autoantigen 1 family protein [Methanolobus sp.]|jgi:UPF0148 protein|uniref:Sjogren's syndrome/scleroderma autoantigen 1 family protein n=1 Tax=Methanolobus sp. TaxID=1874737 RepID=UPI002600DE07|nr:Sjogren's syndrome/scleroderma autoantigen 1 family protein [Methanolobus sp.]